MDCITSHFFEVLAKSEIFGRNDTLNKGTRGRVDTRRMGWNNTCKVI